MKRTLLWTLLLVVLVVFTGGCSDRKDQIPTQMETKLIGKPQPLGGEKKKAAS
jgi:hypothetical protein